MTEPRRQLTLAAVIAAAIALGVAFDLLTVETKATPDRLVSDRNLVSRAVFCPSGPGDGPARVSFATSPPAEATLGIGPEDEPVEIAEGAQSRTVEVRRSSDLSAYGTRAVAFSLQKLDTDPSGVGSSPCAERASSTWYFAQGSTSLGFDERLVIYNPLAHEAVVRVTLFTPEGELSKANLARIAVPARETIRVKLNEFVRQQPSVALSVVAERGRVVAWRALLVSAKDKENGMAFTLGAPELSPTWYFAEGSVGGGVKETVSLLNPTDEEAVVTVTLSTGEETLQPPKLVEVVVGPRSVRPLVLENLVTGAKSQLGPAAVVIRASSGAVVAERTTYYSTSDLSGVAAEIGSPVTGTGWFLGPPAAPPATDSIVVVNPELEAATVSIELLSAEGSRKPGKLQDIRIKGGTRIKIPLGDWTRGDAVMALLTSDGPVYAERVSSRAGDVAVGAGVPASTPTEP